jgi:hypothetical protein
MTVFNNELYIGGYFNSLNGIPISNIAKFDGTNWSSVGGGLNSDVFDLYPDTVNNRLYAVGNFTYANGGTIACPSNVAYWDGISWNSVGTNGLALYPRVVNVFKNELYAGFVFPKVKANGDTLHGIARYDGIDWQPLGKGCNGSVHAMVTYNNEFVVGGGFTQAGDTMANLIAAWEYVPTTIQEFSEEFNTINTFPNPSSGLINIPNRFIGYEMIIYDLTGRVVYNNTALQSSTVDLGFLPPGCFIINVQKEQVNFRTKFIRN